ncbi:MAG: orotidine-5'-phosphate decarboxylase [Chloroflexi bacterium]|nr:MAG: orotidine-5'-phosphate decarboxylase [Chloroflexota bacterium]
MQRLRSRWRDAQTLLCVGLDGELERLPESVLDGQTVVLSLDDERAGSRVEGSLVSFHQAIIDATADQVCAFKPNSAFFEAHGPAGLRALIRLIGYIHARYPSVPVLLDAKRGDISSTSSAYAQAAFDVCDADGITVQPYLGGEALTPFLGRYERGVFIVCRTSNPGSAELQDLRVSRADGTGDEPLYVALARRVADEWNANGNCGLVMGATYPNDLAQVRAVVGDLPVLVPGIGTQGGDLEATLRAGLDSQGYGLIISASRSIIYASSDLDFAEAARRQAKHLNQEINRLREKF